ncbi:uncharacterized protein [Rhodnius prolixus]|uniref:uncharacterized protein n=1 Tax=Rhodnius prolixus TaxID=13249 RepID=UPI003D18A67C
MPTKSVKKVVNVAGKCKGTESGSVPTTRSMLRQPDVKVAMELTEVSTNQEANKVSDEHIYTKANKSTNAYTNMAYQSTDLGPFYVIVESTNKDKKGLSRVHPMSVGKLLYEKHIDIAKSIDGIKKLGVNRMRVEMNNGVAANRLVSSAILKEKGFRVYIPRYLLQRRGVIRDVDTDLTEEEIKEVMRGPLGAEYQILEIRRLKRKVIDRDTKETKFVPTQSVLFSVRGQQLPQYVYIHYVRCEVHNCVQNVIQCKQCLRFGHFKDQCKGNVRCGKCGENHEASQCKDNTPKCVNCGSASHLATNVNMCPQYKKEKTLKQVMGEKNISYLDAKRFLSSNSFAALAEKQAPTLDSLKEFPLLNKLGGNDNRPFASTISYKRKTKRNRFEVSPNFDKKLINDLLIQPGTSKSTPGGIIPQNPYRPSEVTKTAKSLQQDPHLDILYEAVYSILKSINGIELKTP